MPCGILRRFRIRVERDGRAIEPGRSYERKVKAKDLSREGQVFCFREYRLIRQRPLTIDVISRAALWGSMCEPLDV